MKCGTKTVFRLRAFAEPRSSNPAPPPPPVKLTPVSLLLLLLPDISRVSCSKPGSRSPAGRPPTPRNASHRELCAFHVNVYGCAFEPKAIGSVVSAGARQTKRLRETAGMVRFVSFGSRSPAHARHLRDGGAIYQQLVATGADKQVSLREIYLPRAQRLQRHQPADRKRHSSQLSLCLSRACLGKMKN